jgi:hypothetical protein
MKTVSIATATVALFHSHDSLKHWSEAVCAAKVRLYRARTAEWLAKSIAKDAELIGVNAKVIESLPVELQAEASPAPAPAPAKGRRKVVSAKGRKK